ncbi:MAG: PDZ domain-containing protein [Acidobacteriota bacterium]
MRIVVLLLIVFFFCPLAGRAEDENFTRLLRFPHIQGDKIAFVYAGDIWIVDTNGGVARRLTSHKGRELFPKFSPDGKWIAFSAEYNGTRQIYVMSADGGEPKQLTYYNDVGILPPRGGFDNQVLGWSPDGKNVLFRANRLPWGDRMGRPYMVPLEGGMETPLAIPESGGGMLSPDGSKMVYTPIERENRTWKRYRGGRAQDVWIYDLKNNTAEKITDYKGTDNQPMWVGDTIFFTSDREHTLNLYAYNLRTKETRKVTNHNDYDVLWPSAGQKAIVYECGGYIYKFDPNSRQSVRVPIRVFGDLPQTVAYFKNVRENIDSADLSPSGARALFSARGEVFTVPAKDGETRNLTNTQGVREMDATWSPDGKWIAYLSDRTGEYELYLRNQDGSGDERRLTNDGDTWRFPPSWSPDGKLLAYSDKKQRLRYIIVDSGKVIDVDKGKYNDITNYRWSPDSKWLVYTKVVDTRLSAIWVYSLAEGKSYQLTSGRTNDFDPVFDPKGRYLYFRSNRDYNITFSSFEFNYVYTNPTRVYVALLANDGPPLFLPTSDEEKPAEDKKPAQNIQDNAGGNKKAGEETKPEQSKAAATLVVKIDVEGFENRVRAIPGPPSSYRDLSATANGVLYLVGDGGDTKLKQYNIEQKKEEVIIEGISDYALSFDGKKFLFHRGNDYGIAALQPGQKASEGLLALQKMEIKIVPKLEWKQMFTDGWRTLRDWFYDPNMHGVDWGKMRERYEPLVPYIATRADLDFILGELGGELNAGHVYVNSGDEVRVERQDGGLLGAEIVAHSSGYFQVVKIFPGENWHERFRSPLTEPGVKVRKGDFILAVDGRSTKEVKNFYELLENKANRSVTLLVNSKPEATGAHEERLRPVASETNLRYLDWVQSRQEYVERASQGRIGYIHIPNTALEGNRELFKYFYPQANKEALIIDDRYNGGGFIPDRMIELLDRPVLNYWARRGLEPLSAPGFSHEGPKATLINGYSSSGGDAFPYYFRKRGLGKLIGTRTWGGLIGLTGNPTFIDGGSVSAPTIRFVDTEGQWAVENVGVYPDIEVVDRPDLVTKGQDPSLEKAIEVLMEELKSKSPKKIKIPTPPDESK